jgi:hypothetical protein
MVTSRKASEKNVGNRGSKSVKFKSMNFIVKEQRVDGSCFINKNLMKLRCTLMGNERSYQVKIPSNQIIKRRFYSIEPYLELTQLIEPCSLNSSNSSIANSAQLKFVFDPWFITGVALPADLWLLRKSNREMDV